MGKLGDFFPKEESETEEVDLLRNEIAIFKNLIQERKHPLDLVRELLSNAGASEVRANRIEISYTSAKEGHIFEISDDGCGMNYTGAARLPGRLDKFLGLGMSGIVGEKSDEFSWKGLGSKLAYHSRRVEIETRFETYPFYRVLINEPWSSLERNLLPKPHVSKFANSDEPTGTRVKVFGHPPHRKEEPFSFQEIREFLMHRTFAGFTHEREKPPTIILSVLGKTEEIPFGFPEFRGIVWKNGVSLDANQRLVVDLIESAPKIGLVHLKGFLTWDATKFGLSKSKLNTGLILSSKGIPYFDLDLDGYGGRGIAHANPGVDKTCLVVECDGIFSAMNISRSDLVDSAEALEFKKAVKKLLERLESAPEYLEFRKIPKGVKTVAFASYLAEEKRAIESEDQGWVIYEEPGKKPVVLIREPKNEAEVNALIWKLEVLNAFPFHRFQTLAYVGAAKGPDLLVNFQEDSSSEPLRGAIIEVENKFYSYTSHGHTPSQYPKVICWEIPPSGRKVRINKTHKKYKFTVHLEEHQVHIFEIKQMDGIRVVSRRELSDMGVEI